MRIPTIIRGVARKGGPKFKAIACEARQLGIESHAYLLNHVGLVKFKLEC